MKNHIVTNYYSRIILITDADAYEDARVYLETACPTESTGHLAKGVNLIPVNCHANAIRVRNVYITLHPIYNRTLHQRRFTKRKIRKPKGIVEFQSRTSEER